MKKFITSRAAITFLGIAVLVVGAVSFNVLAQSGGNNSPVNNYYGDTTVYQGVSGDGEFGAFVAITSETNLTDLNVTNDFRVQGDTEFDSTVQFDGAVAFNSIFQASSTVEVTGLGIFYGDLNGQKSATTTDGVNVTMGNHQSNHIVFMKGTGSTTTLPAISEGIVVKFVTQAAFADSKFSIDSAEGDNIGGSLIVDNAIVVCADEDQINFQEASETISDWVELTAANVAGTLAWVITSSNGETAGAITCTDPT